MTVTDIDNLQIRLKANANSASRSIDVLIGKIDKLSTSLGTIKSDSLDSLSTRISNLGKSMATLDSTKTADLNKIVNAINRVSKIDATGLTKISSALTPLATGLTGLSNVSNLSNITPAINAIKNLARTDLSNFDTTKLGSIANVISSFATQLGNATKIDASITKIVSAMARLANSGQYINNVAVYFPQLANQVTGLVTALVGAGTIDVNIAKIVDGIARLASAGNNVGITVANLQNLTNGLIQMINQLNSLPAINANLANLVQGIGNIATSGSRAGSVVNSLTNRLNRFSTSTSSARGHTLSLASAIGKLYAKFWILLRVFNLLKKAMDLSSDLTEVQNVVDTTFGDMAYKVEDLAKNSIEQFGMSELALKEYSSRFQAMGTNMGANNSAIQKANEFLNKQTNGYVELSDSMSDVSLTLTKLTADMASFYNLDQKDVAEDLESIFTGQTRPLRTYGLDLTEATLKEWALKNGLDANISSMSQAEKTMLRYQYVLANTGAAQGDFARTADKRNESFMCRAA